MHTLLAHARFRQQFAAAVGARPVGARPVGARPVGARPVGARSLVALPVVAMSFVVMSLLASDARAQGVQPQPTRTQRAPTQHARVMLDTTSLTPDAMAVLHTWQAYLASKVGKYGATARDSSRYWTESEQRRWPLYDLADYYLPDDATPEIVAVERVAVRDALRADDEYRITTRFYSGDQKVRPPTWWTAMTVTTYALREAGEWKLANALPRVTRTWRRDTVGPITYVFAPDYPFNRARAQHAVAFTDSLAALFGVPRLAPLTYFLLPTVDDVYRIMGLESDVKFGATGGAAQPVNRQLFSGIPSVGEEYRHELAHLMLAPLVSGNTLYFVSEGVPTWLGGTAGNDFRTAAGNLAAFLAHNASVTLDSLLTGGYSTTQAYPAGAVLAEMVFDQGGMSAVKQLFNAGRTLEEFRTSVARILQRPWTTVTTDWRARVMSYGAGARQKEQF